MNMFCVLLQWEQKAALPGKELKGEEQVCTEEASISPAASERVSLSSGGGGVAHMQAYVCMDMVDVGCFSIVLHRT